ncbi:hypothetical protein [Nodularia spumigena]|uniref:hypothetical protein n=1 Tax=Nodularia spumigena TaxID=70799 RepID=UPI00232C0115|nr:hypothetical protein [Nodularia spumigena]MDB9318209.1 hypothetical protein [Nodularia spumigena CS-590/01A]MDB9325702.1 hypothetical protein [Nodularia spumigena CS-590/02]MDB9334319.1 hypothetical protein [Nodularia spumigena CS-590/01]
MLNKEDNDDNDLKKLMEDCAGLDAEKRAKLIKHLLGEPGVQVIIGSNQVHATNVYQVSLSSPEQISGILDAIAQKITSEDSGKNSEKTEK